MNLYQHGEVLVTDDGAETGSDLGHYERFVDVKHEPQLQHHHGAIAAVIAKSQRRAIISSGTVQVIPHITNEIKERIHRIAQEKGAHVAIVEIRGTVGDIEGQPFLEAIRQFKKDTGADNVLYVHVTLMPSVGPWSEMKTKPTQLQRDDAPARSASSLDVLVCRIKAP